MSRALSFAILAPIVSLAAPLYTLDPSFPSWGSANVSRITAVAVDPWGPSGGTEVHVFQRNSDLDPAFVFNTRGQLLRTWGNTTISSPHGAAAQYFPNNSTAIWVTDVGGGPVLTGHTVKRFSPAGVLEQEYGTPNVAGSGLDPVQFDAVADVAFSTVDPSVVFVVDGDGGMNNRLVALAIQTGDVRYHVGSTAGSGPDEFSVPHSIAYEPQFDRLWIADRSNNRTEVLFASDGSYVGELTCMRPGTAWGVRIDAARGVLAIADGALGRILIVALNGKDRFDVGNCTLLQTIPVPPADAHAHEMAIDPITGDLYVAFVGVPTFVQRYIRSG